MSTPLVTADESSPSIDQPEQSLKETLGSKKKENSIDEDREQVFKQYRKSPSDERDDESPDVTAREFHNEFLKFFGGMLNVPGGVHVHGNFYNNGGSFVGGNQTNHQNSAQVNSEKQYGNLDQTDYALIPLGERVENWFENHQSVCHRAIMLSMAFLNGSNCNSVVLMSEKLESAISLKSGKKSHEPDDETIKFKTLGFKKQLKVVLAGVEENCENTEFGSNFIEIARFDDVEFQEHLLRYIWQEENYYWQLILDCLVEFSSAQNSQTKFCIAASLSQSCRYRFDLVREIILIPLAKSDDRSKRSLSALCLGMIALDDHEISSQQARNLLNHWSSLKTSPNLRRTSIESYSYYAGLKFQDDAFKNFTSIVKADAIYLFTDILYGIVAFFERSKSVSSNQLAILRHLEVWISYRQKESLHQIAAFTVWGMMKLSEISENNNKETPTLLWLASSDEVSARSISLLVRYSLNLKLTRPLILEELRLWFLFVDEESELRQTLGKIITRIVKNGDSRERLRLQSHLERWANSGSSYAIQMLEFLKQKNLFQ